VRHHPLERSPLTHSAEGPLDVVPIRKPPALANCPGPRSSARSSRTAESGSN
jgi:hypothetical protein